MVRVATYPGSDLQVKGMWEAKEGVKGRPQNRVNGRVQGTAGECKLAGSQEYTVERMLLSRAPSHPGQEAAWPPAPPAHPGHSLHSALSTQHFIPSPLKLHS